MDYLLLAAIFYEHSLPPPHIAAGVNLSFWPIGSVFRKNNAFFIRRQGKRDQLYAHLLFVYVRWLLRNKKAQEFFIEGGRSRTGKMLAPKRGLLNFEVDAYLDSDVDDLMLLPVCIMYDKIPEELSYEKELRGGKKEKESILEVWRSRHLLSKKHGAAHVRFGEAISLKSFFDLQETKEISTKERKTKTLGLAEELSTQIAWQTPITAVSIAACVLLRTSDERMPTSLFIRDFEELKEILMSEYLPVVSKEQTVHELLTFLKLHRWILIKNDEITIPREKRIKLDFYKNSILHFLVPTILRDVKNSSLSEILHHEFMLKEFCLSNSLNRKWHRLLSNYIEAYLYSIDQFRARGIRKMPIDEKVVRGMVQSGRGSYPESITTANIRSVAEFLSERGILENQSKLEEFRTTVEEIQHQIQ